MKLAFGIFKYFPHGGLQRDMMRIAQAAAARGHEVTIYCGCWDDAPPASDKIGVRVLGAFGLTNHGRARSFAARFAESTASADLRVGFNRMPGLDVYFAADNCFALGAMRHSRFWRALLPRYRIFQEFEEAIFQPSSKTMIMYLTPGQKRDFQTIYCTPESRFRLLPPGIPPDRRRPEEPEAQQLRAGKRNALGVLENETLLIQIGSGFRTKGVDRTVTAFAALPPELRGKSRLLIAGRESSGKYQKLARRLGVADRVIFAGGRDDVAELLLASDLMVHPARNEATGTVLVEAIASGVPVICSGNCGFENFVRASGGVVLNEPFSQHELERELAKSIGVPGRLEKMTAAARSYGKKADFYQRAEVAVNVIEGVGHAVKRGA